MSGKRRRHAEVEQEERARRIRELLDSYPAGVHRLGGRAFVLDSELPAGLAAVYRELDGAELFHETCTLSPAARFERSGDLWRIGELAGDDLLVDRSGSVWRREEDTGELLEEGTAFDRWLAGYLDAEAVLYDREGEFKDDIIDEDGELTAATRIARERALLKRDGHAPAPRWRLARDLVDEGELEEARRLLEEVVADRPAFAWAWFDLARVSERLGAFDGARDEAEAAAEADPGYEHAAFFCAQAARLATLAGDEPGRARLAARARELDPDLARRQVDGAAELLGEGDRSGARELWEVAAAIAPRDLAVLDLRRRIDEADVAADAPPGS